MFNSFSLVWWNIVGVFVLEILVIGMLISPSFTTAQLNKEFEYIRASMGDDAAAMVKEESHKYYKKLFIDTGIYQSTFQLVLPSKAQKERSVGMEKLGEDTIFPLVKEKLQSMWLSILQLTVRFFHTLIWLPAILLIIVPFFLDGLYQRKIRIASFQHASALRHRVGFRIIFTVAFLVTVILLSPFAIHPFAYPIMGAVVAWALSYAMANMMKRV